MRDWLIIWHGAVHWTGSDYGGRYGIFQPYDFLSGLAGLSLFGILLNTLRKHNCHTRWCFRIGHHAFVDPATGVAYVMCRKHHPDHPGRKQITAGYIGGLRGA